MNKNLSSNFPKLEYRKQIGILLQNNAVKDLVAAKNQVLHIQGCFLVREHPLFSLVSKFRKIVLCKSCCAHLKNILYDDTDSQKCELRSNCTF